MYADLKSEVARHYLGFLWWAIEPLLYLCVFYFVFGLVLNRGDSNFISFLLIGLVVWKWFDSSVRSCSTAILMNRGVIQQVYVPKYLFPLICIASNSVKFAIVFSIFLLFYWLSMQSPSQAYYALPIILFTQMLLITGCGLLLCSIVPLIPDIKIIIDNFMTLLFFMSGIFFNLDQVPKEIQPILNLNPVAQLITSYRDVLIDNQWPNVMNIVYIISISTALILLGLYQLHVNDKNYAKILG